ncbi:hypothetical protein X929_02255 [Petrotoga olearia DSM 13574]|uniref:Uncharacterized protein n=1 Tax=Petrotoga olearia DSM 13574 TaxID=1122955 RepID=A0A2K1P4V1_9BACT|nr:hypothetical protein X929_02255 [Petrotoga olearia DSM 13574]
MQMDKKSFILMSKLRGLRDRRSISTCVGSDVEMDKKSFILMGGERGKGAKSYFTISNDSKNP